MRPATTSVLLAIAIGLGVWIYMEESERGKGPEKQDKKVLAHFLPESVKEIHMESGGIKSVMIKHDDLWFFEKPVADRADQATAAAVLDLLSHLTIRDEISSEEIKSDDSLSDKQLGFTEEDQIQVTLISEPSDTKKGSSHPAKKTVLTFGDIAPMMNTIFARIEDNSKDDHSIFIVDGNPRKYFEEPTSALRDQTLLFAPVNRLAGLTVKTARHTIKLERKLTTPATGWSMVSPLPARANSQLIESILAQLSSLRVESLLKANNSSGASPNPVPENGVVFELQLLGVEKPVSLFLSPSQNAKTTAPETKRVPLLEARTSDRPAAFLVRSSLLTLLPLSPNTFRDPHLARIPLQMLHSIVIQTRDNPDVVLSAMPPESGQIKWKSDRNSKREDANLTKIIDLVAAVNEERVLNFVDDLKADPAIYGLDAPFTAITFNVFQSVSLKPGANPQTETPQKPKMLQRTLKLGFGKGDANQLFASFVGEPYIYQISPVFKNRVSPHPLKWKSLKVLTFSTLSLKQIERTQKDQSPVSLSYEYTRDEWKILTDNESDTKDVDHRIAEKMKATLGSLKAKDWVTTSQLAYKALSTPSLSFKILIEEIDPALQEPRDVTHTLKFAPTASSGIYYGSIDSSPDVFIIDRETYRDLSHNPVIETNIDSPLVR
ncbi:MAG: DUF4340 domain-containing protein [Verrucomicrobia bacterium]|nr:DUF4340 domain-containing protein [Verrucomicrobiota bacterium]